MEINFSNQYLIDTAHELEIKSTQWNDTVEEIKKLSQKTKYAEKLKPDIEKLSYAGSVIKQYADLLKYATEEYDKNEKSIIHKFEV